MQTKNRRAALWAVPLLAIATFGAAAAAAATPCTRSADKMFRACMHDVEDDYLTTRANCNHVTDSGDRAACRDLAADEKEEGTGLCDDQLEARLDACDLLGEQRYDPDPLLDPAIAFVDPNDVTNATANPYVSIVAGHTYVLRAGEDGEEIVVVHVTGETRDVNGVACRVVVDAVVVAGEDDEDGGVEYLPVEITDDWFAQDTAGNVYYCGEIARNYEEGRLVDIDGSFEAGRDFAKAGVLILAQPQVGIAHRQEFALGEAEDIVQYVSLDAAPAEENPAFPCAANGGCLQTFDFAPLDPGETEFKYYLPGTGFVLAIAMEDGEATGEREALQCVGDSLAVLKRPACGIEDPRELIDALCELAPDAFCDGGWRNRRPPWRQWP